MTLRSKKCQTLLKLKSINNAPNVQKVDNIPIVLALPLSVANSVSYYMTKLIEVAFTPIDGVRLSDIGLLQQFVLADQNRAFTMSDLEDMNVKQFVSTYEDYIQDCILPLRARISELKNVINMGRGSIEYISPTYIRTQVPAHKQDVIDTYFQSYSSERTGMFCSALYKEVSNQAVDAFQTYAQKVNNMFFAVNYFLHNGDLYYVSSLSGSGDWTKTQVSIDDIVYSNGNWIGVRLNSSLATYIGPSLSSMQSRSVSIPQLPSTMEYKGIAASDNGILCILLTKNASTGQGKGIYILACSNLTAATLSFSLITISNNDSDKAGNIVYKNGIFLIRNNGSNKIHWSVNGTTWNTSSNNFDMLSDMTTPVNSVSVYCRYGWVVPGQSKIHILPQFNNTKFTSFFLGVKSKLLSTVISPAVEPLSYEHEVSATFVDSAGATHSITSLKAYQNGIIEFSDSQGSRYRFGDTHLYPITISNLVIAAEQASINITSMNPMNDHTDIGKDGQRIRNIWAEKYDGDVNSKGTSHVVWGAVAN